MRLGLLGLLAQFAHILTRRGYLQVWQAQRQPRHTLAVLPIRAERPKAHERTDASDLLEGVGERSGLGDILGVLNDESAILGSVRGRAEAAKPRVTTAMVEAGTATATTATAEVAMVMAATVMVEVAMAEAAMVRVTPAKVGTATRRGQRR